MRRCKGVSQDLSSKLHVWAANIDISCRVVHLGRWATRKQAAQAWNLAAIAYGVSGWLVLYLIQGNPHCQQILLQAYESFSAAVVAIQAEVV